MPRPENAADTPADWLIGGAPKKRALLEALFQRPADRWTSQPWSEADLCQELAATPGGLDEHLKRLVAMGFLEAFPGRPRRWRLRTDRELAPDRLLVRRRIAAVFDALGKWQSP